VRCEEGCSSEAGPPNSQHSASDESGKTHVDSISSELSLDFLSKDRSGGNNNDDSRLLSSLGSSWGTCRWNPDDSDYSLNVLLPPNRNSEEDDVEGIETDRSDDNHDNNVGGNPKHL
jgi:hypothetical protein